MAYIVTLYFRPILLISFVQKSFSDKVWSSFATIQDANNRISSEICQSLLTTLHIEMTDKVDSHLILGAQNEEDSYSFQSTELRV